MKSHIRLQLAQVGILALCVLILYRGAQVQLFPTTRLQQGQQAQYKTEIYKIALRGNIFDRNQRPMALTVNSYSVFAHPHRVQKKYHVAKTVANILQLPYKEVLEALSSQKSFVWIKRKIDGKLKEALEAKNLPGIHFFSETKRVYPNDFLAAHVLGFVNIDMKGISGLELTYDNALEGVPRKVSVHKDAMGRVIYIGESASSRSKPGYNMTLTLDSTIQFSVEEELKKITQEFEALGSMALAMDPRTGALLSLASYPAYNANEPAKFKPWLQKNRLVSEVFEPGSVLKSFTIAAALNAGTASIHKMYDCAGGKITIGRRVITEASMSHIHDRLSLQDILKFSSNVCAVKVALELGSEKLYAFWDIMGFGKETGIDVPGELSGIVRPLKQWAKIHLATASYGHGIAVTPIQIIRAYGVFANGGFLVQPHVMQKIEDETGRLVYANDSLPKIKVLDERIATQMRKMLLRVTEPGGTGTLAKPFGFVIPGKTGTANKYVESEGGYKEGAYMSSFVGMFPPERPKVVLLVLVDEPKTKTYASVVAAPAFRNISEKMISLLSLHPHVAQEQQPSSVSKSAAVKTKEAATEEVSISGIPNLTGYTLAQVRELLSERNMPFSYTGVGKVISQTPSAGNPLSADQTINIVLKP